MNKLGADLLGSVVHKINRTLDVVRESFSYEDQLAVVFKYMTDQTQTPNSKVSGGGGVRLSKYEIGIN